MNMMLFFELKIGSFFNVGGAVWKKEPRFLCCGSWYNATAEGQEPAFFDDCTEVELIAAPGPFAEQIARKETMEDFLREFISRH